MRAPPLCRRRRERRARESLSLLPSEWPELLLSSSSELNADLTSSSPEPALQNRDAAITARAAARSRLPRRMASVARRAAAPAATDHGNRPAHAAKPAAPSAAGVLAGLAARASGAARAGQQGSDRDLVSSRPLGAGRPARGRASRGPRSAVRAVVSAALRAAPPMFSPGFFFLAVLIFAGERARPRSAAPGATVPPPGATVCATLALVHAPPRHLALDVTSLKAPTPARGAGLRRLPYLPPTDVAVSGAVGTWRG